MKGVPDPGAAGPVRDRTRYARERGVGATIAQLPSDASKPRSEGEGLHLAPLARERMGHMKQEARIRLHRTGDVAEDDEWPRLWSRRTAPEDGGLAERAHRLSERRAGVEPRAATRRPEPTTRAVARRPSEPLEESRRGRALLRGHR